jgi:hypothetical protein
MSDAAELASHQIANGIGDLKKELKDLDVAQGG